MRRFPHTAVASSQAPRETDSPRFLEDGMNSLAEILQRGLVPRRTERGVATPAASHGIRTRLEDFIARDALSQLDQLRLDRGEILAVGFQVRSTPSVT